MYVTSLRSLDARRALVMQSLASPVSEPRTAISWSLPVSMRQDLDQEMVIPHLFRCPISLDVFTDPVTLCTGQTYDRPNIERWLQLGNLTCPVTMQRLQDSSIVPNHTLRHLIEQWTSSVIGRHPIDPDYPLINLKHDLQSRVYNLADKLHVLREVRLLSGESPSTCSRLIRLGFLSLLLELVFKEPDHTNSSQAHTSVEEALYCVIELLKVADGSESSRSLSIFKEENTLASFCKLFELGNTVIKTSLCRVIEATCSIHHDTEVDTTFSRELVLLLYHQDDDEVVVEASLRAIKSLCLSEPNTDILIQGGLLEGLIACIWDAASGRGGNNNHLMAMAILELTLGLEKAREALLGHPNGIKCLVSMVFRVSDLEGSESAVKCLTVVCENSLEARDAAIGCGVLSQLLLLLQSQCNCNTKTKARLLLKLLRSKEG